MKVGDTVIYSPLYERDRELWYRDTSVKPGDIGKVVKVWPQHCTVKFDTHRCHKVINTNNLKLYKEENKMKKVTNLPKFMPGEVVDLSYRTNILPNRILIKQAKITEFSKGWLYDIVLENSGDTTTMEESFIEERMTHKSRKVYSVQYIQDLYESGFRFCGNFTKQDATKFAKSIKDNNVILNIQIHPGFYPSGDLMMGQYGVWIRYHKIITNDGRLCEVINPSQTQVTIIK